MKRSPTRRDQRFSLLQRLQNRAISWLGWILIQGIGRTLRFRVDGWENYQRFHAAGDPVILSFWHNQIPVATYFWRHRGIVVITSEHFDGEYIARIIEGFGYGTSRGSSSRGAVRALLGLKRRLGEGRDVAFTVDGPRGPCYRVKPGPLWLSRKTGAPVVCFHIEPRHFWELGSWDRMRIPKPFSRVQVKIGSPLVVEQGSSEDQWMGVYQERMDDLGRPCSRLETDC